MPGVVHPHPLALSSIETCPRPPLTPEPAVTTGARRQLSSYLLCFPQFNFLGAKGLQRHDTLNDHDDFENKEKDEHEKMNTKVMHCPVVYR